MKQLMSYYRLPGDDEDTLSARLSAAGLDGIENLIYGTEPAAVPFRRLTAGVHLSYWPCWLDFYRGDAEWTARNFPDAASLRTYFCAETPEGWVAHIRANIRAALAEEPAYLVWHVQDCAMEEAWTRKFHHTDYEVLAATAEVYHACADLIPDGTRVLFENIFWPGLSDLAPEKVSYFFETLSDDAHTGLLFDTGHFMVMNPELRTEADGADFICRAMDRLGSLASLIHGVHLSCSLSGEYQRSYTRKMPQPCPEELLLRHICSMDEHRVFRTHAAAQIIERIAPEYVTHELFGNTLDESFEKVEQQMRALR